MAERIPTELRFSNGTTHVVIVETNQYAGNFERELTAFAFGAYDEERYHGGVQFAEFEDAAESQPELQDIKDKVTQVIHNEYGDVSNTIWQVENERKDYNAAAAFFHEPLTDRELEIATARAEAYANTKTDLTILIVRQISVTVEVVAKTTTRSR